MRPYVYLHAGLSVPNDLVNSSLYKKYHSVSVVIFCQYSYLHEQLGSEYFVMLLCHPYKSGSFGQFLQPGSPYIGAGRTNAT